MRKAVQNICGRTSLTWKAKWNSSEINTKNWLSRSKSGRSFKNSWSLYPDIQGLTNQVISSYISGKDRFLCIFIKISRKETNCLKRIQELGNQEKDLVLAYKMTFAFKSSDLLPNLKMKQGPRTIKTFIGAYVLPSTSKLRMNSNGKLDGSCECLQNLTRQNKTGFVN